MICIKTEQIVYAKNKITKIPSSNENKKNGKSPYQMSTR